MNYIKHGATLAAIGFSVGGCISLSSSQPTRLSALERNAPNNSPADASSARSNQAPNSSAATWQMPWQISPISKSPAARKEQIAEAIVPGTGRVRGTKSALQSIGQRLMDDGNENRTVNACRAKIAGEASKFGAKQVEAASAGREVFENGNYKGQVRVRITYGKNGRYEVRESVLTCITSVAGNIVDAYVNRDTTTRT